MGPKIFNFLSYELSFAFLEPLFRCNGQREKRKTPTQTFLGYIDGDVESIKRPYVNSGCEKYFSIKPQGWLKALCKKFKGMLG